MKNIWYKAEKTEIAQSLGYEGYLEALPPLYESGLSLREVGRLFDICGDSVAYRLRNMGIKLRKRGGFNNVTDKNKKGIHFLEEQDKTALKLGYCNYLDAIKRMYLAKFSSSEIAKYFGVTGPAIRYRLVKMGIPMRTPGYPGGQGVALRRDLETGKYQIQKV